MSKTMVLRRTYLRLSGVLLLSSLLLGCINKEPEQRAAFIAILQTLIVDRPAMSVPALNGDQQKAVGSYAEQYQLLRDFQPKLHNLVTHLADTLDQERMATFSQLMAHRQSLQANIQALSQEQAALETLQSQVGSLRASWKQPAELDAVYSAAYDKQVAEPAKMIEALTTSTLSTLQDAMAVIAFVDAHADQIVFDNNEAAVKDPSIQRQLNHLLEVLNTHALSLVKVHTALETIQAQ
jgi:hypothetical protein